MVEMVKIHVMIVLLNAWDAVIRVKVHVLVVMHRVMELVTKNVPVAVRIAPVAVTLHAILVALVNVNQHVI